MLSPSCGDKPTVFVLLFPRPAILAIGVLPPGREEAAAAGGGEGRQRREDSDGEGCRGEAFHEARGKAKEGDGGGVGGRVSISS